MTVYVEQLNQTGFPSGIPGDAYSGIAEDGGVAPSYLIRSAYQGSTVSVDLKFTVQYPDSMDPLGLLMIDVPVTEVTCLTDASSVGITIVRKPETPTDSLSETFTLAGTYVNVFPNEYYKFKMEDLQELVLPALNSEDYLALFDYNPPPTKHIVKSYSFLVKWDASIDGMGLPLAAGEETVTLTQNIYWNYYTSMATFNQVLATGKV